MACCSGAPDDVDEQTSRSLTIDRQLEHDARNQRRECKILLLGMGGSGKSTIVKQMKIIHHGGFSTEELGAYRSTIHGNVLQCAKAIVEAIRQFDIDVETVWNKQFCDYIAGYELDSNSNNPLKRSLADAVTAIWNHPCSKKVLERENELYLMDSAPYFFDEVHRISASDYLPTEADVLRSRSIAAGIHETSFSMGELRIHLFDVSHLRGERKKWIHCFENVTSIICPIALSDYDRILHEDSNRTVLMEALTLFDSIVVSPLFQRSSIILFLNKVDVFKNKLARSPFKNYFPDYFGDNDVNGVAVYLLRKIEQMNRAELCLYPHITQATDTSSIRRAFDIVKETILQNAIDDTWPQI